MALLQSYRWPGNIRELESIVERLLILSDSEVITSDEILAALERNAGNKVKTAAKLGIALKTLYNKIKAYDIQD